jgi:cobalamin biosynthesis protein CobD/CbiB
MNAITVTLAIAAVVGSGFLAVFVVLLIGTRTEESHLSPSSAPHTRMENAARRLLGVYVRRDPEKTPAQY